MFVYVAMQNTDYVGDSLLEVFSSLESAKKDCESRQRRLKKNEKWDDNLHEDNSSYLYLKNMDWGYTIYKKEIRNA